MVFIGETIPTRGQLGPGALARTPKPPWLKTRLRTGPNYGQLKHLVQGLELHTVCEQASCPNIYECWEAKEATFLILGSRCTRRCGFCDIATGKPGPLDYDEPRRVAEAVKHLGLKFAVVTGVERDDAAPVDVASIWAGTIRAIRELIPDCKVEVLTGDLKGVGDAVETVVSAGPDVFAHNLEAPRRLHRKIRPGFRYDRSLEVLAMAKRTDPAMVTKSNIIVGMGETTREVFECLDDLRAAEVDLVTIGQYLAPSHDQHLPVDRWVRPEEFAEYSQYGRGLGFAWVEAGPLVRSSYHAGKQYRAARQRLAASRRPGD
jgi:lipoyl synthase